MGLKDTWKFVKNRIFSAEEGVSPKNKSEQSDIDPQATMNIDMSELIDSSSSNIDTTREIEDDADAALLEKIKKEREQRHGNISRVASVTRPQVSSAISTPQKKRLQKLDRYASGVIRRRNQGGFGPDGFFKFMDFMYPEGFEMGRERPQVSNIKLKALTEAKGGNFIHDMLSCTDELRHLCFECANDPALKIRFINRVLDYFSEPQHIDALLQHREHYDIFDRMVQVIEHMTRGDKKAFYSLMMGQLGILSLYAWLFNELTHPILQKEGMKISQDPEQPQFMTYLSPESIGIIVSGQGETPHPTKVSWMLDRKKIISAPQQQPRRSFINKESSRYHDVSLDKRSIVDTARIKAYLRPIMIHTPTAALDAVVLEQFEAQMEELGRSCRQYYLG